MKMKGTIGDFFLEDPGWSDNSFFARERKSGKRFVILQLEPDADVSDPTHRRWFRQMQMLLRSFEHPNVVVPTVFTREGKYYIAREFVEGTPLNEAHNLESGQVMKLINPVVEGITAARRVGIAHGSIKAEKIIITPTEHPKLIGLGEKEIILGLKGLRPGFQDELTERDTSFIRQIQMGHIDTILLSQEQAGPIKKGSHRAVKKEAVDTRYVNTWFDADELPIRVNQSCRFNFNIGPRVDTEASGILFKEPDFGSHSFLLLRVTLFSEDFAFEVDSFEFDLPKSGVTKTFTTNVTALRSGAECVISVYILLAREKQTLQVLTVTTEIAEISRAETLVMVGAD
jgi:serine/threonine protein kinase